MRRNKAAGNASSGGASLCLMNENEFRHIHEGTLATLRRTGIYFEDEEARAILGDHGAEVNSKTGVVKIPGHLVEDAIRSAPSELYMYGREAKHDFIMGGQTVNFTNFGEGITIKDMKTGEIRPTLKQDVADVSRLIDALDQIDACERPVGAHDVPQQAQPLHNLDAILTNTSKHIFNGAGNGKMVRYGIAMASAVLGGRDKFQARPFVTFNTCPISPLKISRECSEAIIEGARGGVTITVLTQALAGGTAPVTMAGTLIVHNSEVLAGITLSQLAKRGSRVIYGSSTCPLDLKTTLASVGAPECGLLNAGVATLANYYQLPSFVAGG